MSSLDKTTSNFMRSLCMGEILEDLIIPFPKVKKEEAESLRSIIDSLSTWLKGRDADFRKWDVAGEMPESFLQEMREFGLFSFFLSKFQHALIDVDTSIIYFFWKIIQGKARTHPNFQDF